MVAVALMRRVMTMRSVVMMSVMIVGGCDSGDNDDGGGDNSMVTEHVLSSWSYCEHLHGLLYLVLTIQPLMLSLSPVCGCGI